MLQYIITKTKKREILFKFLASGKIQKHLNFFKSRKKERKKEEKTKVGEITSQNNSWFGSKVIEGSA